MNKDYIEDLVYLRGCLDNIIDNAVTDALRNRGSSKNTFESLEYRIGLFSSLYPALDLRKNKGATG